MKVAIFGTGNYYERYKKWIPMEDIAILLDNNKEKQGKTIDGHFVIAPADFNMYTFDRIYIFSVYCLEMRKQLIELGVPEDRIFTHFDLHKELGDSIQRFPIQSFYSKKEIPAKKKVLLVSYDLQLNGAAMALYYMALVLSRHYFVTVATAEDGPLRDQLIRDGIHVLVDVNLQIDTMQNVNYLNEFDLIICNTLYFYQFLSERNTDFPVLWWLHDGPLYYNGIDEGLFRLIPERNLYVYGVGDIPVKAFKNVRPDISTNNLLYGLADWHKDHGRVNNATLTFAVIGSVQERKGQDIFIQAIRLLPVPLMKKARFLIVGDDTSLYAISLKATCADIPEIEFMGTKSRTEIEALYTQIDVLVCPSRQDPMPIVVTEAMMNSKCCIVSDVIGSAKYVEHGVDGLLFPMEDVKRLAELMECLIRNPGLARRLGEKSRIVYEQFFSLDVFERNILDILNKSLII